MEAAIIMVTSTHYVCVSIVVLTIDNPWVCLPSYHLANNITVGNITPTGREGAHRKIMIDHGKQSVDSFRSVSSTSSNQETQAGTVFLR